MHKITAASILKAAVFTAALALVPLKSAGADTEITLFGSTTVQPLAEKLGEAFEALHSDIMVTVGGGGSSVGVKAAGEGTADIGMASREVKESEFQEFPGIVVHTIARDGIAIVAHPGVSVSNLTVEQVRQIFSGEISNWSGVGGPNQVIVVIAREEGSGTRAAFEELVMDEALITSGAILLPSNGAVRTSVSTTPNSIAFLSFGYLDPSVRGLSIEGIEPSVSNAKTGIYPVVRPLNMITPGPAGGAAARFLEFIMSPDGQAIVSSEGYISVI
ncbi:phosphate ABC transporter substrate-binding protein [Candidatus Fermentibacterales bacterium]|nr:phosphate ABC transporter substrate-binding protein [Candidatus Fermentibacterales bacterium]